MDRTYALAVVLGAFCISGCVSTQAAHTHTHTQTQEEKVAEFRQDVRGYERLQGEQSERELASEFDKRTTESSDEPIQAQKVDLPK